VTRLIPFLLYLWLVALHQVILSDAISILGVSVNLPVLLVLLVGLYKSELGACWFGFVVGLVAYTGTTTALGWHALVMAVIGFLTFHSRARVNLESIFSKLLLVFVGIVIHNIFVLLMTGGDGLLYQLFTRALPGALYTTLFAWVFFLFKEGKVTYQKFKAIF